MQVTKSILAEQILRIISGGFPSERDRVKTPEILLAISDVANAYLKSEVFSVNWNIDGTNAVDGAAIVTYEAIPVIRGVDYDKIRTATFELPAYPMLLPEGIGVYEVYPTGRPHLSLNYIPSGQLKFWLTNRYMSSLHRKLYTVIGNKVAIYDDYVGIGYNQVDVQLVVSDISSAGENEPLPISADLREKIVASVLQRFIGVSDTNRRETDQPSPTKRN